MKIHAIRTGSVRIKHAQVERQGRGFMAQLAIFADREWTDWVPTFAWAIEHRDGVIVVDTGHDGGLAHFPRNEILVAPGELVKASGILGQVRGYLPQRWPSWFDPKPLALSREPFGGFPLSRRLTADGAVVAVATPGHTANHLGVVVQRGDAMVFLAGDTSYTEQLMVEGKVDGVSPDEGVAMRTLEAIKSFAKTRPTIYLPTHDPDSAARLSALRVVAGS